LIGVNFLGVSARPKLQRFVSREVKSLGVYPANPFRRGGGGRGALRARPSARWTLRRENAPRHRRRRRAPGQYQVPV